MRMCVRAAAAGRGGRLPRGLGLADAAAAAAVRVIDGSVYDCLLLIKLEQVK